MQEIKGFNFCINKDSTPPSPPFLMAKLPSPLTNHFGEGVNGEALPNDRTAGPKRPHRRSEVTGLAASNNADI
jgi:hypothetical protein